MTYRVQVLDENERVLGEAPTDWIELDGTLVLQLRVGVRLGHAEAERIIHVLKDAFPGRKVVLLPPEVQFVRLIREDPHV